MTLAAFYTLVDTFLPYPSTDGLRGRLAVLGGDLRCAIGYPLHEQRLPTVEG